jgi:hypothetical protein
MGGDCSTHARNKKYTLLVGNPEGGENLGEVDIKITVGLGFGLNLSGSG